MIVKTSLHTVKFVAAQRAHFLQTALVVVSLMWKKSEYGYTVI
jgi:hypothetical protein